MYVDSVAFGFWGEMQHPKPKPVCVLYISMLYMYTNTVTVTLNLKNKGFEDQFGTNLYNNIPKKLNGETSTQTQVLPDSFWSGGTLAFSKLMSQNGSATLLPLKRSVAICSGNITNYLQPSSYGYHHLLSSVKCSIQTLGLRCTVATRSGSGEVSEHQTASNPTFFSSNVRPHLHRSLQAARQLADGFGRKQTHVPRNTQSIIEVRSHCCHGR